MKHYPVHLPRLRVVGDAEKRQRCHGEGVEPRQDHDSACSAKAQAHVEVYCVCDGVPAFQGDYHKGHNRQL